MVTFCRKSPADAIIVDAYTPETGGIALLDALAADRRFDRVYVVAMTESRSDAIHPRANGRLVVPFGPKELFEALRRIPAAAT